ncbi:hypothetical protein GCM10025865_18090 [Paraoerskovia sediminicola]|uniref:glucan endo-1,3-beta-D-glucosidase n=1 Tax=Paraoerskovia sediminicola TaxID=1138587 RepID=A0ABM8G328_9CELL|nr:glycosyl hydrolase [Paraoerskovia sediminicola]BDZ42510.1 hypothetical protein GCM10025865_18090 [Paraoerskovia sediminicola]
MAFALADGGFGLGLPDVTTTDTGIVGPFTQQVGVDVGAGAAADAQVVAYDTASVTVGLLDPTGEPVGSVVLAEGSPLVSFTADADASVTTSVAFGSTGVEGVWFADVAGRPWVLLAPGGATDGGASGSGAQASVFSLGAGETATWFPLPDGMATTDPALADLVAAAGEPVVSTDVRHSVADDTAATSIDYVTADGSPVLVTRMPHQQDGTSSGPGCGLGTYATVAGTVELCATTTLDWSVPAVEPAGALDLDGLSDEQRDELADQVRADAAAIEPRPSDTYFGGKALARDTNLLVLAEQLGLDDVAGPLREDLAAALREWTEPDGCEARDARCFVYDPELRSVVGMTPSFGSEELNDHHFHYGYFLYAAGVLGADDATLVDDVAPVIDLLAADVAAGAASDDFPATRPFDVYRGHSWASGFSPFADGNNQESASEAVSAWNGLALWAEASGDAALEERARWMLSAEAASAKAYWTDFDQADPANEDFGHSVTSLVWNGKRDWATWFSAEPSAMLGIVVLPMHPVADYLAGDPERIRANLDEALVDDPDGYDVMFGDYLLMYAALAADGDAAESERLLAAARALPDERIDDGDTRSYLLAWLMAHTG